MILKTTATTLLATCTLNITAADVDHGKQDLLCMATNLYFEARGESQEAQASIAKVVINRTNHKSYPSNVCKVIFQYKQFSWTHQQSWKIIQKALNGHAPHKNSLDTQAYHRVNIIASRVLKTGYSAIGDSVLFYHSKQVKPTWAKKLKKTAVIGKHVFYASK